MPPGSVTISCRQLTTGAEFRSSSDVGSKQLANLQDSIAASRNAAYAVDMSRLSSTLGPCFVAFACAVGCKPSAPPSPPHAATSAPAAPSKWSVKSGEPLRDSEIPATVTACAAGELDDATVTAVVQRLAEARDSRGEPCFLKALKDYKPDATEELVGFAARAVAAMQLKSASGPLFEVFRKIRTSQRKTRDVYRPVHSAMITLLDRAWEDDLISILERPIDRKVPTSLTDEMFWQSTAAECLGLMKSEKAVRPLIKITLSPPKAAAHMTAVLALVEIGKPAVAPTVAVLRGQDQDLLVYSMTENVEASDTRTRPDVAPEAWHIGAAALILATMGRPETTTPLLDAIGKVDPQSRAIIALQLTKVPKTPEVLKAFKDTFERTPGGIVLPGTSLSAREALLEASPLFFDSSLVPWITKSTIKLTSTETDIALVRKAALTAVLKLATTEQVKLVNALYNYPATLDGKKTTVGKEVEQEYKLTLELLSSCTNNVECYVNRLDDPAFQDETTQFVGIKSAHMIGALGSPSIKVKLLASLPKISSSAVHSVTAWLVDVFSPKGDAEAATTLQKLVDEAEAAKDQNAIQLTAPLRTVIYRLNARAE
jgi:hypothetical protein